MRHVLRLLLPVALLVGSVQVAAAVPAGHGQYWIAQLGLTSAWRQSTGEGVKVGVIDTGVDDTHADLTGAVLPGRAFPDRGDGLADDWGHGTRMALLIAGRGHADGSGTIGVAPGARIVPAKVTGTLVDVDAAIRWLVGQGVTVINISLGGRRATSGEEPPYAAALRFARDHDVVVVAAAGNTGMDHGVASPADHPDVVAVSAVDGAGVFRPEVSVAGPEVALAAPGVDIVTAVPGGEPTRTRGTSEAAALVSGVAALVRARFPELDADEVIDRLTGTAKDKGPEGRDERYGFGVIDPVAALADVSAGPLVPSTALWLSSIAAGACLVIFLVRRRARRLP